MTCFHPLKGFILGVTDSGKKDLKVVPFDTVCLFKPFGTSTWERHGYMLDKSVFSSRGRLVSDFVQIPCGQCIGCRLDYSRQWAIRCMLESEYHEENYFITLTYDEEHVPRSEYVDSDGCINESLTLVKKDLQDFNKRLRSALSYRGDSSFRFYACGEYGSSSARPHYHLIAFGLHLDDLVLYKKTDYGSLYNSLFLDSVWKKGHVVVGGVSYESCAYVSRYIMKKQKGVGATVYDDYNILPEFVLMSRNPGLGKLYFDDNFKDIYPNDKLVLDGGKLVKPPRYFDNLMDAIDEELMEDVKLKRADIAERINNFKVTQSTADYQQQLVHAENNKAAQIKRLVRPLQE